MGFVYAKTEVTNVTGGDVKYIVDPVHQVLRKAAAIQLK